MRRTIFMTIACAVCAACAYGGGTVDPANAFAYGANIGWVAAQTNGASPATIGRYYSSGCLYGANVGWVSLGSGTPANGWEYANSGAGDYGVNHDGAGRLRGYAYGANIGWITFENLGNPTVDLASGNLQGLAWGANVGWISLSNTFGRVRTVRLDNGPDSDGDGIPDPYEYKVAGGITALSAGIDSDGDGVDDDGEYLANTDALDNGDVLQIVAFDRVAGADSVAWSCNPTRFYSLLYATNLVGAVSWADAGTGLLAPDPDGVREATVTGVSEPARFYGVRAVPPLDP